MPERVIALDPGERVGWAAAEMSLNRLDNIAYGVLALKDMALSLALEQGGGSIPPLYDTIVYETWRPRPKNGTMEWIRGDNLLSAQFVGMTRLIAWRSGAKLVGYGPDRKKEFTASMSDTLRKLMDVCSEQHPQDALMHLWGYYFLNWFDPTQEPA